MIHCSLERATTWCRRFNDRKIEGISVVELDVVSILAFDCGRKTELPKHSRPLSKRSSRMILEQIPLVVTDGFGFYEKVVRRLFGPACLYGRVIKTRRNDCIVKVERRAVLGDGWRLEQSLHGGLSETQHAICRTICQAPWKERLDDHLELLRCHHNFVRPIGP
jgi:hypothetical protein